MIRTCLDCPKSISRRSAGRCRRCAVIAANKRAGVMKARGTAISAALRRKAEVLTPATEALVKSLLRELSIRDTHAKLAQRADGQHVTWQQIRRLQGIAQADDARAVDDAARAALTRKAPAPSQRAPLTFDEQLARVAAGARLVPTFRPSRSAPDQTLGGVATGML